MPPTRKSVKKKKITKIIFETIPSDKNVASHVLVLCNLKKSL